MQLRGRTDERAGASLGFLHSTPGVSYGGAFQPMRKWTPALPAKLRAPLLEAEFDHFLLGASCAAGEQASPLRAHLSCRGLRRADLRQYAIPDEGAPPRGRPQCVPQQQPITKVDHARRSLRPRGVYDTDYFYTFQH